MACLPPFNIRICYNFVIQKKYITVVLSIEINILVINLVATLPSFLLLMSTIQRCGRVRGCQYEHPNAFYCNLNNYNCFDPLIKTYGVTLTYSNNPRKHIWTYAGGYYEQGTGSYIPLPL